MKIVADSHIPFIKEYFDGYGDLILKPGRKITHQDVKDADILLVRSITPVNKELLDKTKVKFVGSVTAGADHLDTKWLDEAGISWAIATGFNAPPVADYVLSVIAALQRKLLLPRDKVKVAIIGAGNVGSLVAERLKFLNFDITLCDPLREENEKNFKSISLNDLSEFDLISLHVPLTRHGNHPTFHFIDKTFLNRQKIGCILLNTSRGAVINSQDLLTHGAHLQWCFDVWEHEPHINKVILDRTLIATPHIAGYSIQSKMRGINMIYQIACEKKFIPAKVIPPLQINSQQLAFAGENHHWQDIILGIFNPLIITAMMRTLLLTSEEVDKLFDEMRNQFNYRYEFAATKLVDVSVVEQDKLLLEKLGVEFS